MKTYIDGFVDGLENCAKEAERMAALMASKDFIPGTLKKGISKDDAKLASATAANAYAMLALSIRQKIANANAMPEAAKKGRQ